MSRVEELETELKKTQNRLDLAEADNAVFLEHLELISEYYKDAKKLNWEGLDNTYVGLIYRVGELVNRARSAFHPGVALLKRIKTLEEELEEFYKLQRNREVIR